MRGNCHEDCNHHIHHTRRICSLATDSLHLLATVATTKANDATNESTTKIKDTKMEAQLDSRSVNPIIISRVRALNLINNHSAFNEIYGGNHACFNCCFNGR